MHALLILSAVQVGAGLIIGFSGIPLQLQPTVRFVYQGYVASSVRVGGLSAPTTSERINGNHIAGNFVFGF